ncbi:nuclear transport factor 2 family protein [Sulfobacillus harzensis]|uniref:SnoaL-like domain-containing protein n=1 Tax=Sulfobacillus harzensis TaxID=2729629 RepID=A0A7Y0Q3N8_9FIRM|nr:nuclear transport factor 2 family protein [Sulfobacillus harzensis]NMP23747.1 SnoaL-like domain-containing protein [Sulfobacillus harzensis]
MSDLPNHDFVAPEPSASTGAAELFERVLEGFRVGDPQPWIDLLADDAVLEIPFAPPGRPQRIDGKRHIIQYLHTYADRITITQFTDVQIHRLIDPNSVVAEMTAHGMVRATGETYDMRYVVVVRTTEGRIRLYRDYWNPLTALGTEALEPTE